MPTPTRSSFPPELSSLPRLCDYAPCGEVLPTQPPSPSARGSPLRGGYRDDAGQTKVGYVMLSTDITDIPAYSGKPVVTLIGAPDTAGKFTGVKILKHSSPSCCWASGVGLGPGFNNQYLGQFVGDNIEIGGVAPEENLIGLDARSPALPLPSSPRTRS